MVFPASSLSSRLEKFRYHAFAEIQLDLHGGNLVLLRIKFTYRATRGQRMVISCVLPIGVAAMNFLSRLKVAATKNEMSNWRILGWAVVASGIVGVLLFGIKLMSSLP